MPMQLEFLLVKIDILATWKSSESSRKNLSYTLNSSRGRPGFLLGCSLFRSVSMSSFWLKIEQKGSKHVYVNVILQTVCYLALFKANAQRPWDGRKMQKVRVFYRGNTTDSFFWSHLVLEGFIGAWQVVSAILDFLHTLGKGRAVFRLNQQL